MPSISSVTPVITLDGPSGSGKGTISQLLARILRWNYLDSGAIYRVVALAAMKAGVSWEDEQAIVSPAQALDIRFVPTAAGTVLVLLAGNEVTQEIRSEACGEGASCLGAYPSVREALLAKQRAFREPPGLVTDGRDMGTVVFPDASLKIFLSASLEERARRRFLQLHEQSDNVSFQQVLDGLQLRDKRDMNRATAPLKPAADAIMLDTSHMGVDEVVQQILNYYRKGQA